MYEGRRAQSPFDDSAAERLRRMGLADGNGVPDRDAITVCSCIFAGQFFDDLCDYFESYEDIRELISSLSESAEDAAEKQKFLLVCLQYDVGRQIEAERNGKIKNEEETAQTKRRHSKHEKAAK